VLAHPLKVKAIADARIKTDKNPDLEWQPFLRPSSLGAEALSSPHAFWQASFTGTRRDLLVIAGSQ
jgi:hypothetical protein